MGDTDVTRSAARFNMQQRIKDGAKATRPNVHTDPATGKALEADDPRTMATPEARKAAAQAAQAAFEMPHPTPTHAKYVEEGRRYDAPPICCGQPMDATWQQYAIYGTFQKNDPIWHCLKCSMKLTRLERS